MFLVRKSGAFPCHLTLNVIGNINSLGIFSYAKTIKYTL